jgi:serine/threonine-protein kinase
MSTSFKPQKFGRYILLDHYKSGGMAEIYRARLATNEDANRLLIIKKIAGSYAANEDFVKMFKSEIKVSLGLTHPNIVQIYDYGELNQSYYLAMEYVDGKTLKEFVTRLKNLKSIFSLDISANIAAMVCSGMQYAHSFKDPMTGKPLNIIHRDLSPQNVMISYDGTVKILDFGIAKAESKLESTQVGTIKGKLGYLVPEYINGHKIDHRYDIFAIGIVLWELLTARRLFQAENEIAVLKQITDCEISPPSKFNKAVPKELDQIVMKALSKNASDRYQSCDEMQRALHRFIYSFNPNFNPADLSNLARELFKKEIAEDRETLAEINQVSVSSSSSGSDDKSEKSQSENLNEPSEEKTPAPSGSVDKGDSGEEASEMNEQMMSSADFSREAFEELASSAQSQSENSEAIGFHSNSKDVGGLRQHDYSHDKGAALGSRGGVSYSLNTSTHGGLTRHSRYEIKKNQSLSWTTSPLVVSMVAMIVVVIGVFIADKLVPCKLKLNYGADVFNSCEGKVADLTVNGPPTGATVVVNGVEYKPDRFPFKIKHLPVGETVNLKVLSEGYAADVRKVEVGKLGAFVEVLPRQNVAQSSNETSRDPTSLQVQQSLSEREGLLYLTSNPPSTKVTLVLSDRRTKEIGKTPIKDLKLPVGKYTLRLTNELLNRRESVVITIKPKKRLQRHVSLLD